MLPLPSTKHELSDGKEKQTLLVVIIVLFSTVWKRVLKEYDADFKTSYFALVELANEEELEAEQVILDNHTAR